MSITLVYTLWLRNTLSVGLDLVTITKCVELCVMDSREYQETRTKSKITSFLYFISSFILLIIMSVFNHNKWFTINIFEAEITSY